MPEYGDTMFYNFIPRPGSIGRFMCGEMKKILCCVLLVCLVITTSCQKTEIPESKAITLCKAYLESINSQEFMKTITNLDSPNMENLDFDDSYVVFYREAKGGELRTNELKGKKVWKISYSHPYENLLGSYTVYLDRYSGEIYGKDLN
jgi:hypothetical protein